MKKISALLLFIAILLVSLSSFGDTAYKYTGGNIIKWNRKVINICIKPDAYSLPNIKEATEYASNLWNSVSGIPKTHVNFETADCDIFIDYNYAPYHYNKDYLAMNTITNFLNGDIFSSRIEFNKFYDGKFGSAARNYSVYDVQSIICHELGHALGLEGEPNNSKSVMYEYTDLGVQARKKLTQEDIRSIKKLYANSF